MPAVYYRTLGCKLNYSETATYQRQFEALGAQTTQSVDEADICVLNSCGVTEQAQKKCRQELHRMRRLSSEGYIVLVGCYADLLLDAGASLDVVDLVVGRHDKFRLAEIVLTQRSGSENSYSCTGGSENYFPAFSKGGRTRAFLKIQDGCDYHCTYCAIPQARGASRSGRIVDVVQQVETIAAAGILEVVITGVNTGEFGRGSGERFVDLVRALDEVEGIQRYRISSLEPNLLTDELIGVVAQSRAFLPHFHIPLQSGSNDILRRMGRRYTTQRYAERIAALRAQVRNPFVGIDLIVGFPGESAQDFEQTYSFLEQLAPSYLHLFPYSRRPGTPAASYPDQVSPTVVKERMEALMALNRELESAYAQQFLGTQQKVLVERIGRDGSAEGHTENYLLTRFRAYTAQHGAILPVVLKEYQSEGILWGEAMVGY